MIAKLLSKDELEKSFKELLKKNIYHRNGFFNCPNTEGIFGLFYSFPYISVTDMQSSNNSQRIMATYYDFDPKDYFNTFRDFSDDSITPALSFKG